MLLYSNVLFKKPYKMIVCRVYFKETPVEVVKEHDQELSKLGADALIPAMLGHVVQAFTLLKSSPEAQVCNCIALITCYYHPYGLHCYFSVVGYVYSQNISEVAFEKRHLGQIECTCYH